MESNVMLYFIIYMVIIGVFILLILSPLSLYLSFRLFKILGKKTLLTSLALSIPCLGVLSLSHFFKWNAFIGYLITGLLSLIYFVFLLHKIFRGPLIKSIGLALSYGLLNALFILACLFILSLISRDQPLEPEAQAWLSARPPVVADDDNLYYALIGFSIDPKVDPHQAGLQCVRQFNEYEKKKAIAQKQEKPISPFPACFSPNPPLLSKDLDILCEITKPDCLERFRTEQNSFNLLINKYQYLITRYRDLSHYSGYSNVGIRGLIAPLLQASPILNAHRLFVAQIMLNYLKGNRPESLRDLQQDMTFQRQNIVRSDNFIFLMVSASLLNRDLYLYSQLLDQDISEKSFQKELGIPLLSDKEIDIENALQGEFQNINSIFQPEGLGLSLDRVSQLQKFPQKLVFKPNATINRYFYFYKNIFEWTRLPTDKLSSSKIKTLSPPDFLDVGYNPVGIILLSIADPVFKPYMYRLHNLDGLIRLVKIKQRIRHDRIAKNQIDNFLKQDLPYCKNPYTNQPMTWDAKTETLYFMDPSEEGQKVAVNIPFSGK